MAELTGILDSGRFSDCRGIEESQIIEFKGGGRPYDLDSRRGKRDLAADVASMANADGGVIVLGVKTAMDETRRVEYASEVQGVKPNEYSEARIREVLKSHCYPPPTSVTVKSYDGTDEAEDAVELVAIKVGPEPYESSPVFVDRLVDEDDQKVGNSVGWPRRYGDSTIWEDGSRIQELVRQGRQRSGGHVAQVARSAERLHTDLQIVERQEGWDEWAIIALQISPQSSAPPIPDFFGSFRQQANAWSPVRARGFGINPSSQPLEPVESRLALLGPRTQYLIQPSGAFTAAALGAPAFLGWAKNRDLGPDELSSVEVNPYPLVEFVAEAVRFFHGTIWRALEQPSAQIRVLGLHLRDRVPLAVQIRPGDHHFELPRPCIANSVDERVPVSEAWDVDAFACLSALLGRGFGVGEDEIPFAREKVVDLDLLK